MSPQPGRRRLLRLRCSRLAAWLAAFAMCTVAPGAQALDPDKALHHFVADQWTLEDGLPQVQVTAIAQGPAGFLWIGTHGGGLARFDGVRFRTFVPEDTPALLGLSVRSLYLDRQERLWIGTYRGVTIYEAGGFRAPQLRGETDASPASDARTEPTDDAAEHAIRLDVRNFAERLDDFGASTIAVATDDGVLLSGGDTLERVAAASAPAHAVLFHDGALWVGEVGHVRRVVLDIGTDLIAADADSMLLDLPGDFSQAVVGQLVTYQGTVWAGTTSGLFRWTAGTWQRMSLAGGNDREPVQGLLVDRDDVLWVATSAGLARVSGTQALPASPGPPPHPDVLAIGEDHEGNIWLGANRIGLTRLRNGWTRRFAGREGLHAPAVWSLVPDPLENGAWWIGTVQGLARLRDERFELVVPGSALPHPGVYTLLAQGPRVWLGTHGGGLAVYEEGNVNIPPGTEVLADAQIASIVADGSDGLWLGTSKGLCRYRDGDLRCYARDAGLRSPRVRLVLTTRDGRLLVGAQSGLYQFDGARFTPLGAGVIPEDEDITSLDELSDGTLAVGSLAENLYLYRQGTWYAYDESDGLPLNSPFFTTLGPDGSLWVAGLRGLYRLPWDQLERYDRGEIGQLQAHMLLSERGDVRGAQRAFCCNGAGRSKGFIDGDGVLWLPTRDGVVSVDTTRVRTNPFPPEVVVDQLRTDGDWQDYRGGPVTMAANTRDLTVRFTALSFQAPDSVRFRYRLQGFDDEWKTPDDITRRTAYYTNLPPGRYQFEVLASNNDDVWQQTPATATIVVEPFFHETRTFFALLFLAGLTLLYGGYRLLLAGQQRQRAHLQALVEERTEALRVANEHLSEMTRRLQEASRTDPLTGLRNRRYLDDQLPGDIEALQRKLADDANSERRIVFALIDLDHFKSVNDSFGHGTGDEVLCIFAELLGGTVRAGDYAVRWGGEEFVVVLRDTTIAGAEAMIQRILDTVASHPFHRSDGTGQPLQLSCSIGYAAYPFLAADPAALSWEETIEIADRALYAAKHGGRRQARGYHAPASTPRAAVARADLLRDPAALVRRGTLLTTVMNAQRAGEDTARWRDASGHD